MKGLLLLLVHLVAVLARLFRPGGVRGLVAENLLLKQHVFCEASHKPFGLSAEPKRCTKLTAPSRAGGLAPGLCSRSVCSTLRR